MFHYKNLYVFGRKSDIIGKLRLNCYSNLYQLNKLEQFIQVRMTF